MVPSWKRQVGRSIAAGVVVSLLIGWVAGLVAPASISTGIMSWDNKTGVWVVSEVRSPVSVRYHLKRATEGEARLSGAGYSATASAEPHDQFAKGPPGDPFEGLPARALTGNDLMVVPAWTGLRTGLRSEEREWIVGAFGWPLPCVACGAARCEGETQFRTWGAVHFGEDPIRAVLPLKPVWRNLAINTGVFAPVWWAVFYLPGTVRWWRRARNGRCPDCGYDLSGLVPGALCPECGRPTEAGGGPDDNPLGTEAGATAG